MSSLVIAEHDNSSIKPSTLNTISAALACGGDVHLLVAGHNAAAAAAAGAQIAGLGKGQQGHRGAKGCAKGGDGRGAGGQRRKSQPWEVGSLHGEGSSTTH